MSGAADRLQTLPMEATSLRALLLAALDAQDAMTAERDMVAAECRALALQNDKLRHLLLMLKRLKFGSRSERLPEAQLHLGIDDLETAIEQCQAEAEKAAPVLRQERTRARRASRGALPAHLPRIEVTVAPGDTNCPCCRAAMSVIGEDSSERLDVIPAQYRVIVTKRPKLVCRSCWPARLLRTTVKLKDWPSAAALAPVTGRCRRQTGHKGGRSLIAKARMRSHLVVVPTPAFDQNPSLGPGAEPLHVQAFVAELAIEALADAILPRLARIDQRRSDLLLADPLHQRLRDELRAVVRPQKPGRTALAHQPRQHLDHTRRS